MSNPALQVYGGDEISAVVIDPGSYSTNIGYSGTDCPQAILPSCYGDYTNTDDPEGKKKKVFSEQSICIPRKDYEIKPIVENGVVIDWDAAQEQWSWALENQLYLRSNSGIPALLTEPIWNTVENRKKSLELLLEGMDFEACYLASTPTCVSFGTGRSSCLVVDLGHDTCSVSPVVDGMTLSKSTKRNFFAGGYLNELIKNYISPEKIIPLFAIDKRRPELKKKVFEFPVHESLYKYANDRGIFQECKETLCQVAAPSTLDKMKSELATVAKRSIETPWTEEIIFDNETRYGFAEQLFLPRKEDVPDNWNISENGTVETWHNDYVPVKRTKPSGSVKSNKDSTPQNSVEPSITAEPLDETNENGKRIIESSSEITKGSLLGVADLVHSSIMASDVDLRATLAHNVVLTGGTSTIPGLSDRLMAELNSRLPALKFRMITTGHTRERQYQSWLGGSVLTSLGTFHQLWVGKEEYQDVGVDRLLADRFR
ncbi:hypothetical protein KAFR_0A01560 [Kazachstania africana CBS 2517]|uniref:Actin-related protein 4 n=1 Tax=Kazachstania africana (strain ATCC 22294 / BCRC 22015 / CBS 2517 / CECT 1963 / NBRC 1671 / NRRL Y-8276) TaxID=1071382 RepID=H2AMJ4_KAZAF|nr:hypothetical protein KAFR_0A01560 [Kazachstania africana CBS 2517]CCF55594.1 hypothetical protein KAFR_0A01560 [Kazachstania africana CBS 2517]